MDVDDLLIYLDKYWNNNLFKVKTDSNTHYIYAYSSRTGKFLNSNRLNRLKIDNFDITDFLLWESITLKVRSGKDVFTCGGLFMKYDDYRDLCGKSSYFKSKKKFIELDLLLPTPHKKYFILNPYYACKLNNLKIEK